MALLCRVPTLEETIVQVCVEVCTGCPTLNAAQIAGCGTAFAVLVGTLLGPPPVVTDTSTTDSSPRKRRHPDFPPDKKTRERDTLPAYPGLRAVHTPAVTPVVGPVSTRWETRARLVTKAVLDDRASDEFVMRTLQETPRVSQQAVRVPGEHKEIVMALLAGAVGLVLLGEIVHKVLGRIIRVGTGGSGAKMTTLEENRANLERIFHTQTPGIQATDHFVIRPGVL